MQVRVPSEAVHGEVVASARRGLHELALSALIGGNVFGRVAMHPALTEVSDKGERGKVLNRAWRRYGTVNSLALATLVAERLIEREGDRERRLGRAQDAVTGVVVLTGLASAASGVGFAQQAPGGAVPMTSGHDPAPEAPRRAARLKQVVNALGAAHLAAVLALVALDSAVPQASRRLAPVRRWRRR